VTPTPQLTALPEEKITYQNVDDDDDNDNFYDDDDDDENNLLSNSVSNLQRFNAGTLPRGDRIISF
jgi:hypothetical protein